MCVPMECRWAKLDNDRPNKPPGYSYIYIVIQFTHRCNNNNIGIINIVFFTFYCALYKHTFIHL